MMSPDGGTKVQTTAVAQKTAAIPTVQVTVAEIIKMTTALISGVPAEVDRMAVTTITGTVRREILIAGGKVPVADTATPEIRTTATLGHKTTGIMAGAAHRKAVMRISEVHTAEAAEATVSTGTMTLSTAVPTETAGDVAAMKCMEAKDTAAADPAVTVPTNGSRATVVVKVRSPGSPAGAGPAAAMPPAMSIPVTAVAGVRSMTSLHRVDLLTTGRTEAIRADTAARRKGQDAGVDSEAGAMRTEITTAAVINYIWPAA